MKAEELSSIVKTGQIIQFDPDRRYVVVINRESVPNAVISQMPTQLRRMGVKAAVLLADFQEGREPPLQVFEMKAE
jgi:hypothetical protein